MDVGLIDETGPTPGGLLRHPYGWLCLPFQGPITLNHRRSSAISLGDDEWAAPLAQGARLAKRLQRSSGGPRSWVQIPGSNIKIKVATEAKVTREKQSTSDRQCKKPR